jgi:O-antigen/teichoic acid export membrane protein
LRPEVPFWLVGACLSLSYWVAGLIAIARFRSRDLGRPAAGPPLVRAALVAGAPLVLASFTDLLAAWAATLTTGILEGSAAAGQLRGALQVATVAALINLVGDGALAQRVAAGFRAGDLDAVRRHYRSATLHLLVLASPILAVAAVAADPILRLFGPDFPGGAAALRVLAAAYFVSFLVGPTGTVLLMCGAERWSLLSALVGTAVLGVLCLLAVPVWGAAGGAAAIGATLVRRLIGAWVVHRKLGIRILSR